MNAGSSDDVIFTVGDSVVAAVQSKGRDKYLLIDSGACENVAKGEFDADVDPTKAKPLFCSVCKAIRCEFMGNNTPKCR